MGVAGGAIVSPVGAPGMAGRVGGARSPLMAAQRKRSIRGWIAGAVSFALIATIAVVASGYDARETPREEPGVWVVREAGQYARVNTDTGELDVVQQVEDLSGVLQSGDRGVVLSNGNGQAWPVNAAQPQDLGDSDASDSEVGGSDAADGSAATPVANDVETEAAGSVSLPDGTREVLSAGRFVALRTEANDVFLGELNAPDDASNTADLSNTADAASGSAAEAHVASASGDSSSAEAIEANTANLEDLEQRLASLQQIDPYLTAEDSGSGSDADGDGDGAESSAENSEEGNGAEDNGEGDAQTPGDGEKARYQASAIALTEEGDLTLLSSVDRTVYTYSAERAEFAGGERAVPEDAAAAEVAQFATVNGDWVVLDAEGGTLWREDAEPIQLELAGESKLQASGDGDGPGAAGGSSALVADSAGLWRVPEAGEADRVAEADGFAAQPVAVGGVRYAAWIGQSGGTLWASDAGSETTALQIDDSATDLSDLEPVFRSNGTRAVLSEVRTGMLWTLPDGTLIPLSQWSISDPPKDQVGTVVVDEVTEQVAPTAVDDAFGARAGDPAPLPVLLNDFDANKSDVLTVVAESLGEKPLPKSFGTLQLMPDGQSLAVTMAADATGSASFTYRVTDGTLTSDAATVTVTVAEESVNTAPEWCAVDGCQREWGVPAIMPGGTLVYPLLEGWVDAEGDVMVLADVEPVQADDPVRALVTADGRVAIRHTDPNADASDVMLRVTVQDARGEERFRELVVAVKPDAVAQLAPNAASVSVDEPTLAKPLSRVAGGSGSFALVDAVVQGGSDALRVSPQPGDGAIELVASDVGSSLVSLTVRDTVTQAEITGVMRVTANPAGEALVLPPLRAFVRPLTDTTIEVLDAVPGADSRAVTVASATVVDGELQTDVIEHTRVRVAGGTEDGAPGRVGAVDITVASSEAESVGRLTVFQVPETVESSAIAVADTATVRAGSVVDVRVLDNDVSAPGERLLLHPEVTGSGTEGELAFASGSVLRYLAPKKPGTYRLSYTTFGASSPESSDVGEVLVTVLRTGSNRDPQPRTLTARVAPGESADVQVPLSGVDADGDRVRLVEVASGAGSQLAQSVSASRGSAGSAITVSAATDAKPGVQSIEYTVRDDYGGTGVGVLRVIVTTAVEGGGAPIASTDYVRLVPDAKKGAVVRPLDNDIDPARGTLTIVSVVPNMVGKPGSAAYDAAIDRLDLSRLKQGVVTVAPSDEIGTVSFTYTVKSSASSSTAEGLIVAQTSERVGTQAPTIDDTVMNVRDRAELSGGGVDVVTDRVRWATGDISSLKLSLWGGNGAGYRADGKRIVGSYNPKGDLVVFRLTGTDDAGSEVESYGFLVIPSLDELRLTTKPGFSGLTVDENDSVEGAVRDMIDYGANDQVELRQGTFASMRSQATCETVSARVLRYTAGKGEPWNDTCLVDARLVGQQTWTTLPIAITISPKEPLVQLNSVTRTVAPGSQDSINLNDMVSWHGDRHGNASKLRFEVTGGGSIFEVKRSNGQVTVQARADAVAGAEEVLSVSATGSGESRAPLTLRVGEAPRDTPRGATVALKCTVGSECRTDVIGAPGEYDPFAGTSGGGLKLASVNAGSCQFGSFSRVGDTGVAVSWPGSNAAGGTCSVSFTVRDAQGRTGEGTIEFDAQGLPQAPASIRQTGFDASSATFAVTLGGRQANPAVSRVELSGAGSTSCTATGPSSYTCVASGLENGAKHQFTARAVNAVGKSGPSSAVTAWAYRPPQTPNVTATPIKNAGNTDQSSGGIRLSVTGSSDTASFKVAIDGADSGTISGSNGSKNFTDLAVGQKTFSVTPVTSFEVPEVGGASSGAKAETTASVIGAPKLSDASLAQGGNSTEARVTANPGNGAHDGEAVTYTYGISAAGGSAPDCSGSTASSAVFAGLEEYREYQARVCAKSEYGISTRVTNKLKVGGSIPEVESPRTYTVGATPTFGPGNRSAKYGSVSSNVTASPSFTLQYRVNGNPGELGAPLVLSSASVPTVEVRQCKGSGSNQVCSTWVGMSATGAPAPVDVTENAAPCFVEGEDKTDQVELLKLVTVSGAAQGFVGSAAIGEAAGAQPSTIPLRLTWTGMFSSLDPVTINVCYTPAAPDPPAPSPGDTP